VLAAARKVAVVDVGAVLLSILIILIAAKIAAEIAERIGIPAVVAEIVAGVIVGPSVLGFVGPNETLAVLAEIGVILLLLQVGLEIDLRDLGKVGRASFGVAVIGIVVPMATGFAVAEAFSFGTNTALFLGATLAATSVGITARVFSDLRALTTIESRTVLGAAVIDDVMGLVILTVVVRVVSEGSISIGSLLGIIGIAVGFLVAATALGFWLAPPAFEWIQRRARTAGTLVALALAFTLGLVELATAAQLGPIVGAFVAGVVLSRSKVKERVERELAPVGHLFIPVFFLQIGVAIDVSSFTSLRALEIGGALFVVAVLGKLVASIGMGRAPGDKLLVGLGMIPRGEVGLIFATIGIEQGVFGPDLYAAVLMVVLATTLLSPPLLRIRLGQLQARRIPDATGEVEPREGWLHLHAGVIELTARPPDARALAVSLDAARHLGEDTRPGSDLLNWLGNLGDTQLVWDESSTRHFITVLKRGSLRAWRFLETTGMLQRALPELADSINSRQADPFVLDPAHVLTFALVGQLQAAIANDGEVAVEHDHIVHPEWLVLAALIIDVVGIEAEPEGVARSLVNRLDLGTAAEEEIMLLVGSSDLLRSAASHLDGQSETRVLQIASYLETAERARALYILEVADGVVRESDRERLDSLFDLVLAVITQPQ